MTAGAYQKRAPRYEVSLPLLFRQPRGTAWESARTINVSRTGVLFRTEGAVPDERAGIEFIVTLPPFSGGAGPRVRCTGRVARVEAAQETGGPAVAITIDRHEFLGVPPDDDLSGFGTNVPRR